MSRDAMASARGDAWIECFTHLLVKECVHDQVEFLLTSLVVVLIPGTGVVYTVSTGLVQGRKASLYAALGCTLGIVPHLLATVLGLAFLPQFVPHEVSRPLLLQLLLLSAVFMVMTFAVFVIYGWVAHASRRLVIESAAVLQWLRYGLASAFTGLGIKLALTEK